MKTLHKNASMPSLHNKFAYSLDQIDEAKTKLKITFEQQQFDADSAQSKMNELMQHVKCELPYTICYDRPYKVTSFRKSN